MFRLDPASSSAELADYLDGDTEHAYLVVGHGASQATDGAGTSIDLHDA